MNITLDKTYFLSSDGFSFKYRVDRYNPNMVHVEMFHSNNVVHKICAKGYGRKLQHHEVINALESAIQLKELDPTGLKQRI